MDSGRADPTHEEHASERVRLETLIARDGMEAAQQWARWAATLYRGSVTDRAHYASQADKKPLFEKTIVQLEIFAERGVFSGQSAADPN